MNNEQKVYILRSRRSKRFFQWRQYAEDGWGKYEDSCDGTFERGDIPAVFSHYEIFKEPPDGYPWVALKDHDKEDVDIYRVNLYITKLED